MLVGYHSSYDATSTHPIWLLLRDQMACALDKHKRPVPLLVNDTSKLAVVVDPGRRGSPGEALDAAEGRILDDDCAAP